METLSLPAASPFFFFPRPDLFAPPKYFWAEAAALGAGVSFDSVVVLLSTEEPG